MSEIFIHLFKPEIADQVIRLHADYYAEHWGFDARFKAQVGREITEFVHEFDAEHDGFWWASCNGVFAGAIAVDGSGFGEGQARLRWFIVPESCQGRNIGCRLFDTALAFCRKQGFHSAYLWTFAGLYAARALYERGGFRLVEEAVGNGWGPTITEQKFELSLTSSS